MKKIIALGFMCLLGISLYGSDGAGEYTKEALKDHFLNSDFGVFSDYCKQGAFDIDSVKFKEGAKIFSLGMKLHNKVSSGNVSAADLLIAMHPSRRFKHVTIRGLVNAALVDSSRWRVAIGFQENNPTDVDKLFFTTIGGRSGPDSHEYFDDQKLISTREPKALEFLKVAQKNRSKPIIAICRLVNAAHINSLLWSVVTDCFNASPFDIDEVQANGSTFDQSIVAAGQSKAIEWPIKVRSA